MYTIIFGNPLDVVPESLSHNTLIILKDFWIKRKQSLFVACTRLACCGVITLALFPRISAKLLTDFVRKISSRERRFARLNILRRAMASGIVNEVLCTKYHVLPSFTVILCILKTGFCILIA